MSEVFLCRENGVARFLRLRLIAASLGSRRSGFLRAGSDWSARVLCRGGSFSQPVCLEEWGGVSVCADVYLPRLELVKVIENMLSHACVSAAMPGQVWLCSSLHF